jgi:hypothetical protein
MYIYPSTRRDKRFMAIFHDNTTIHFGSKNGETYIDHKDDLKRENYIKRHRELNEDWSNPYSAGTLSRYILWEKPNLRDAIKNFKRKFNIK